MAKPTTGYVNGSNLLLKLGTKFLGHCTSHTITYNTETKDRAVKPVATATTSAGLWKEKGITGVSVSISAEGLRTYDETEMTVKDIRDAWKLGTPIQVYGWERDSASNTDYNMSGSFVITSFEEAMPAQDDVTYSITLENNGQVLFDGDITSGGGE